jgi:hypothetical protein
MINDDQGVLNAELSKLAQANLIEAARVGDEEGIRRSGHVLYLLAAQRGSSTDTAKAETVTPLDEGKSGGGNQVSMTVKKGKAKAKKAKLHPHAHKGVKLTARHWPVWVAVKALLNAKRELAKGSKGFYSLSGRFVATFMGTPFWTKEEVNRVNAVMATLKKKGLLTWEKEQVGKSKRKIKGGIAFGPNA